MADEALPHLFGERNPNWRGGRNIVCACGKEFWAKPSLIAKGGGLFCSRTCYIQHGASGKSASNWRGGPVDLICHTCGSTFSASRSEYARRQTRFCSRQCMSAGTRKRVTKTCSLCEAQFEVPQHKELSARYCSRTCKQQSQKKTRTVQQIAQIRIDRRMSALMWYSIKGGKHGIRWERHVGYTLGDLVVHLEQQFKPGMTWDNIGEWHIDHIRPRSSFSYSGPDDAAFKECWSLANLQPLWAAENMSKGARLDWAA